MSAPDARLVERVRGSLAASGAEPTPARVAAALRRDGQLLGDETVLEVTEALRAELIGAGPLDPLLRQRGVSDILVNAPDQVWLDRGSGLEPAGVRFPDESAVRRLAQRLATVAGRRLDDAVPYVDARLPGGVRLHAVLPPISPSGTLLSLRVPARQPYSLEQLISAGSLTPTAAAWLRALVTARLAFLVTGGTGTGKTTVLASLLSLVDPHERLVLVEDSGELQPDHPHVVRLEARPPNVEGVGAVTLTDLVRQALRMRPDRLVVGEVRGAEVVDLLAALNTGHEGGCGTLHANSATDVLARLEALALAAGLARAALHSQVAAGLHAVVHLVRDRAGRRRLAEIDVLQADAQGWVSAHPAILVDSAGETHSRPGLAALREALDGRCAPGVS